MSTELEVANRKFLIALAALYLIHLLTIAYVFPSSVVFAGLPYGGADYQTHYHQTYRLAEALRTTGRWWAYEPQFLAGQPAGIIFDVDNKAYFLFSYALSRLGLPLAVAFNLFPLLSSLIAPLCLLLSARLLGVGRRGQLAVLALATPTYFLDTACRYFVTAGMVSYVTTTYLSVLALVLFWRLLRSPGRAGLRFFLGLLVLYPLAHLVHVFGFPLLVGPTLVLYLRAFRRLPWTGHLQVLSIAAAVIAVNAHWLYPSLANADLMTHSAKIGQAKPFHFLLDLLEVFPFSPPATIQTTLFRYVALAGAGVVVYRWTRARDERWKFALLVLGWFFFLAYVSAYLPLLRLTEPYRFILAITFAAVVVAGPFYAELLSPRVWREQLVGAFRPLAIIGLVLLLPQLGRQVLASAPELIPKPEPMAPHNDPPPWERKTPPTTQTTLRLKNVAPDFLEAARYLEQHCTEPGRILVEPWELAEFLGWATDLHVIGGFPDRRLVMESSNLFHDDQRQPRYWKSGLPEYLQRYNVRYVIIRLPLYPMIEHRRELFQLMTALGPYRIYRTRQSATFFVRGSGQVSTALNRIVLTSVKPDALTGELAIRFHYLRTLRCRPSCHLVKVPIADSKASFIGVVGEPRLASTITLEHLP